MHVQLPKLDQEIVPALEDTHYLHVATALDPATDQLPELVIVLDDGGADGGGHVPQDNPRRSTGGKRRLEADPCAHAGLAVHLELPTRAYGSGTHVRQPMAVPMVGVHAHAIILHIELHMRC